jgi:hypothetical protein
VRVADRDDELADAQRRRVTEQRRLWRLVVGPQQGEVGERVGADHAEPQLPPVGEGGADAPARRLDDVRRGEQEPVRRDEHPRAAARGARPPDAQVGHRRRDRVGDVGHHP